MSIKSVVSGNGAAMLNDTNGLSTGASLETNAFPVAPNTAADVEIKRAEQQMYAHARRAQIEAQYAQQERPPQDKLKPLKPKPGERVVTMRGKKVIRTETVPQPQQQRTGAVRPRAGERVVTMTPSGKVLRTEVVPQQLVKPTLATYRQQADKLIQGAGNDVRERNRAITGAYASLYMQNPQAFVWLGAAAYASGQVGYAMDIANETNAGLSAATLPNTLLDEAARTFIRQNSGAVRQMLADGNIAIYRSIYPASLAYQHGGIQELRQVASTLKGEQLARFSPLLNAYEQIDKGVKLNQRKAGAGEMLITEGTNEIIRFEQKTIVQPIFDKHPVTVYLMGQLAFGDLDADDAHTDKRTFSRFRDHHPLQNFGNPSTRNDWIENEVFVLWDKHRTERFDEVRQEMHRMTLNGQAAGGRY